MTTSGAIDPSRNELTRDGKLLGRFHRFDADPPTAELFQPVGDIDRVVDVVLADLAGWNLTTTHDALASALVDRGATPTRHFSLMSVDLRSREPVDEYVDEGIVSSVDVRPLGADDPVPPEVVPLVRSAYPTGHPDEELGSDDEIVRDIQRAQSGGRMGPLMSYSALFYDADRLAAMLLVNRVAGSPPLGGPWVTDVCRVPDSRYAGLGRSILLRLIRDLRNDGEAALSLAVTEGNPARNLYESLGLGVVATTRKLRLPQ